MTPFADVRLIVAGDVCNDVLIAGHLRRFSRDAVGVPVLDVTHRSEVQGGAAAAARQVEALGAQATLVPVGAVPAKTRIIASNDVEERHIARFDDPWPAYDAMGFLRLLREQEGDAVLYCQYRSEQPDRAILGALRGYPLVVADVRDPSHFVGVADVIKISVEHAAAHLFVPMVMPPHAARRFCDQHGYRAVVVTAGAHGYVCATAEGAEIAGIGLEGAVRSVGAGDVFSATLACALVAKYELREALKLANKAAGLACQKKAHLSSVDWSELDG